MSKRFTSAIVFVIVMVAAIYVGPLPFIVVFGTILLFSVLEYLNLVFTKLEKPDMIKMFYGIFITVIPFFVAGSVATGIVTAQPEIFILTFFVVLLSTSLSLIYELSTGTKTPVLATGFSLTGLLYIGIPFGLLVFIVFKDQTYHPNIMMGLLLLHWANDTGAYFVGSKLGRNKLLPRISPKKTWEGLFGGIFFTIVAANLIALFATGLNLTDWIIIGVIAAVFGALGDLVESMIKRYAGQKDSGNIMPGHGGFLDRFDAFIFSIPFIAAYLYFTHYF